MPTSPITETLALLLVGLMVLVVIVIIRAMESRKGNWRATVLTIALTLAACTIVGFGIARAAVQAPVTDAPAAYAAQAQPSVTPGGSEESPTQTATQSEPPTALPSLTPTMSATPIVLYTPIKYVSTYALTTPTNCSVVANQTTYLRGDPSEKLASVGSLIAGSLLNVIGRTTDDKWWEITTNDDVPVEGWVRADYVTADSACNDQSIPVVGPTVMPTQTPRNSNANGGSNPASTPVSAVTAGPCSLIVTVAASLRPDPSLRQVPLAQIPELTALHATERSANGQWWHVTYNNQDGWVGAGAVLAERSCDQLPRVTPAS